MTLRQNSDFLHIFHLFNDNNNLDCCTVFEQEDSKGPPDSHQYLFGGKYDLIQLSTYADKLYREFSPYANFITANFVTAVFQKHY